MCLKNPFLILVGIVMIAFDELEEAIEEAIQSIEEQNTSAREQLEKTEL